jgi:hypothetical protein
LVSNLAEDDVLAIEPAGHDSGDEELGAVAVMCELTFNDCVDEKGSLRVGAGVGHGQEEGPVVLPGEVLVGKLLTVDGLAARALLLLAAVLCVL